MRELDRIAEQVRHQLPDPPGVPLAGEIAVELCVERPGRIGSLNLVADLPEEGTEIHERTGDRHAEGEIQEALDALSL